MGARPTLEINGIGGGFYGDGFKTVLPHQAGANISCRLVPDQNPAKILAALDAYIQQITPPTVKAALTETDAGAPGILVDRQSAPVQAASRAYEVAWGVKPIFSREGGSVPIVAAFQQHMDVPVVLMPFGYKGGGAHGPDEYVPLHMLHKGIAAAITFYREYADLAQ